MQNRTIDLESVRNCRDLGGLMNQDGLMIKRGKLIRSANLASANLSDLRQLQLGHIVDLRTSVEIAQGPDVVGDETEYVHMPIFDEVRVGISHEKGEEFDITTANMVETYKYLVLDKTTSSNFSKAVKYIINHCDDTVLWHCTEGKDRCGLTSAFILSCLGVSKEKIYEDYLMTNIVNEPRANLFYRSYLQDGFGEKVASTVRDVFLAKKEYLDAAYEAIESEYGNMVSYISQALDISAAEISDFKFKMLVK